MARTVFETWSAEEPAPEGATFLERALSRALATLDGDVALTERERQAAKGALAAALAGEIRDVLARPRALRAGAAVALRGFTPQPGSTRPGYFREPGAVVGLGEGEADVRLSGGAATWLRLMPAHDPGRTWTASALRAALRKPKSGVLPIFADARGVGELMAGDGCGLYARSPVATETSGVVFAFRTGEVWSLDTYVQDALSQQEPHAILPLEPQLTAAFARSVALLERLGAPKPYRWIVGMDGLMGRSMELPEEGALAGILRGDCVVNTVVTEGVYDGEKPAEEAIGPFFDDLYRACSTPVG